MVVSQPVFDADRFVEDLGDRSEAVGGAGGVGDHLMPSRVVKLIVDAHDKGFINILAGGGDDRLSWPRLQGGGPPFAAAEEAGRFVDIVHSEFAPRQLGRVTLGKHPHTVTIDDEVGPVHLHGALIAAVHRVVPEKVAEHVGRRQVVDGDQVETVTGFQMARKKSPDASKTVDRDLDAHNFLQAFRMARKYSR